MSSHLRTRLLAATAAIAGSAVFASGAQAVAVEVRAPTAMFEASPGLFSFSTVSIKDKLEGGSVNVIASPDATLDPSDPVIGTASFQAPYFNYASVQAAVDDRIANPNKQHVWTFFFVPTAGIELNIPSVSLAVSDDDTSKQGFLSSFLTLKGRTLELSYTFMEPQASGTLRIKNGKKVIGKKTIKNTTDGVKTVKARIVLGSKNAAAVKRKRKISAEFTGSSAVRDLYAASSWKLSRR